MAGCAEDRGELGMSQTESSEGNPEQNPGSSRASGSRVEGRGRWDEELGTMILQGGWQGG